MDNEMIERVAKAMFDKACPAIRYTDDDKLFYGDMAIAAIKAMREPTKKMLSADEVHPSCHMCGGHKEGWYNMIDSILNEH